jgi:hypothetical protein
VKTDLLNMMSEWSEVEDFYGTLDHADLLASLMQHEVSWVRVPGFTGMWCPETEAKLQNLVEVIGAQCPNLTSLHLMTSAFGSPPITEGSTFGHSFFRVLPRLSNLRNVRLDFFICDNWSLHQFAMHATNLLCKFLS